MLKRKILLRWMFWLLVVLTVMEGIFMQLLTDSPVVSSELPSNGPMPFDPVTLWRLHPDSSFQKDGIEYRTDSSGRRQSTQRDSESILFLGDSSTFGMGVASADSLPAQSADCSGYNAINAGVSGYSSAQLAEQLPGLLDSIDAKWIIVAIPWSDVMFTSVSDAKRLDRARRVSWMLSSIKHPILGRSFTARWLLQHADRRMLSNPVQLDPESILRQHPEDTMRRVSPTEQLGHLQHIHRLSSTANAKLLLMHLPTSPQSPGPPPSVLDSYRRPINIWAKQAEIPVLDGDRLISAAPSDQKANSFVDLVHPSPIGHQLLAAGVCAVLSRR